MQAKLAAAMTTDVDTSARLYQKAAPLPASGYVLKPKPASESYKRLHERFTKMAAAIDAGIKTTEGDMKLLLERVKAAYTDMPAKLDATTEGAAYRLFAPPREYRDDHGGELFARYWVAKEGGEFALRALAKASMLSRATHSANTWSEPKTLSLADSPHVDIDTWGKTDDVWLPIREWAASLDAASLAKARSLVVELRNGMSLSTRALLDAAVGDAALCTEDARELVTASSAQHHAPLVLWPVLFSMDDAQAVSDLVDTLSSQWALTTCVDQLPNLVARLGARAAPVLLRILGVGMKSGFGTDRVKEIGQTLALIHSAEVAEALVERLNEKDLRAIATEYLHHNPPLALAPLASAAIGKGAHAELGRSVLGSVAAKAPDEAKRVAQTLAEPQRTMIEAALERFENLTEADPSELPRVLAHPPWLEKKRAKPPRIVADLATLPHTSRIVWNKAEREEHKNLRSHYTPSPANEKAILAEIAAATSAKKAASVASYKLMQLPKESAIHTLETAPLEIFSWYYGNVAWAFIARYELDALSAVMRYATVDPTSAIEAFVVVDALDVAPIMADALMRLKKSRTNAQTWLLAYPETAAIALVPLAIGDRAGSRPPATTALRYLSLHGKRDVVERVGDAYGPEAKSALADVLDFDPLSDFPAKLPKLPSFFSAAALPRPTLVERSVTSGGDSSGVSGAKLPTGKLRGEKKVLPVAAVEAVGTMLAFARIGEPYAGIAQVKEACDPQSLAEMAWELFQAWLVAGAPSKEQWAFLALAHFGNDECARKLTPLIRAWPGEAAHARAVVGLDVLAAIGTDVALMHLHGIAQKVKFKGLQQKAREKIDQIAEARGLTADELGDRLVPDLGLDDDGSLILDFGARKFRMAFDEMLKPAVIDESGKRMELPKPNKSDDPEKSAAAVATWKALKKDAKTVAQSQLVRLELAMCSQRRWEAEAFHQFFVSHPLLIHIVRRLVWGAFDKTDVLVGTFRVGEDRSYADVKDGKFVLPAGANVGLVHRLHMDQKEADAWGQVLGDYEIMQPFAQLSREAILPSTDEHDVTELSRVVGLTVPTGKVLGLDTRGWRRGPPQDGGVVCWYEKPLGDGWVACLDLDPGIYTGMIAESPQQKLGKCVVAKDANSWRRESLKKLGELSPIQFSELVRDLESVRP